jgi:hypothetical protein
MRSVMQRGFATCFALTALGAVPTLATAGPLAQGTVVRVATGSIESGWHRGRMVLDTRKCWMVQLDRATREGYTMLALSFVDAAEVASGSGWSPLTLDPVVRAQPAECLEQGAD